MGWFWAVRRSERGRTIADCSLVNGALLVTDYLQESYFDVINRGEMHQIYKIKTNNVKGYKIKPPLFSIGVNEKMRVFVDYLGLSDKPSKDRISVVYAHHANVKDTVEQAWHATKQLHNTPEKRAYVVIHFKEEKRRSMAELNDNEAQKSVMGTTKSASVKLPQGSSRIELQPSSNSKDDSYYGSVPVPSKVGKSPARKRNSGTSNCSTEPSEETNEDTKGATKGKKKGFSQTAEATEEDPPVPAPPVKPRSRRKVATPPPPPPQAEDEEDAPRSPNHKTAVPVVVRRKQSPARPTVPSEPADDEMTEAPIAPRNVKTRKPVQQQEEEEDEAPPPPPKPVAPKPRSRRKVHTPPPPPTRPVNEEDEETRLNAKKVASPARTPRSKSPNPKHKTRKKSSGSSIDPLESLLAESKVVYVIQQDRNDEEEEESDKKTRKKSKGIRKKSSKRRQEEDDEDKE